MLLVSLIIVFISPITFLSVTSLSLPSIEEFKYYFREVADDKNRIRHYLQLQCIASGFPSPVVEFQFNGYAIKNTTRIQQLNNRLIVNDVSYKTDEGTYRCVAKNSNGQVFEEKHIRIKTTGDFLAGNKYTDPLKWVRVKEGQSWELFCPDHTHVYPAKYHWGKVDKSGRIEKWLDETKSIHVLETGSLYFNSLTKEDIDKVTKEYGGISCIIEIGSQYSKKFIKSRRIAFHNVGIVYNDSAPMINVDLESEIFVKKGEDQTFRCIAGGNPVPRIEWFRNGQQIQADNDRYGINPHLPTKLTVRAVDESVIGQFKCVAINRAGKDESSGNLRIAVPPKFYNDLPLSMNVSFGEKLRLTCAAKGTDPIKYKWYKNGRLLSTYVQDNVSMVVSKGVLTITPVAYGDKGIYQCSAQNEYGSVSSVGDVNVTAPKVTTGKHNGSKNETDSVDNTTKTEGGGDKIHNTTKEHRKSEKLQMQHIVIIACGGTVFVILLGGGLFMYCRTKDDSREVQFIPTSRHETQKPLYTQEEIDFPPPPMGMADSSDDFSTLDGTHKMNEFIDLMSEIRSSQNTTPSKPEHLYYELPEDIRSITTPSTDL